jgi:hypothetical protein
MTENLADALGGFFCFPRRSWRNQFLRFRVLGHGAAKEDKLPAIGFLPRRSPLKPPSDAAGLFFKFPEPMAMSRVRDSGRVAGGMC